MFVSAELFDLRAQILRERQQESGVSEELTTRWLKIDDAFRHSIVKSDISQCEKHYKTDEFVNTPKPPGF